MKKDKYLQKAVEWANKSGYSDIKTTLDEHDTPSQYQRAQDDTTFTPDMTANKGGKMHYFEVVTKDMDDTESISKLRLLSELAKMKGGDLFLLAPTGHMRFAKDLVDNRNIHATVMRI